MIAYTFRTAVRNKELGSRYRLTASVTAIMLLTPKELDEESLRIYFFCLATGKE
jgi:hypothetical protein